MPQMPFPREYHANFIPVAGGDHFVVAHGTASMLTDGAAPWQLALAAGHTCFGWTTYSPEDPLGFALSCFAATVAPG